MPFKSEAQRRFLYSQEPEVAEKFAEHTPKGAKLPERKIENKEVLDSAIQRRLNG